MTQTKRGASARAREAIEAQRREEARRKNMMRAGLAVGAVVIAIVILVAIGVTRSSKPPAAKAAPAASGLVASVTGLPASTLDTIAKGKIATPAQPTSGQAVLTADGKPLIFYMGAEYCPFCAAERWPMIVALSRFGTFSNLSETTSSSTDVYPSTPTFSFHGSTYTSNYITFQPVEVQSNQPDGNGGYTQLDKLTPAQQATVSKFDSNGSFPFVDFANQSIVSGASYNPQLLAGKTQAQVAAQLQDPSSDIAQAVGGTANSFTAEICKLTNNQPSTVCSSPAVAAFNGSTGG